MPTPVDSPVAGASPPRTVWVERRPDGRTTVVFWSLLTAPAGFAGFNVYRSPQPCSDLTSPSLEKLTSSPIGVSFYLDDVEPLSAASYLVTRVADDGEHPLYRPVQFGDTLDPERYGTRRPVLSPPRIAKEFRRRKGILLKRNAEDVIFLIRRMFGRRCPSCFDGAAESASRADCSTCYGTGWERGYEPVYGGRCRVLSIEEALKLQLPGLVFSSAPKGWHVGFPLLRQGDIVVRPTTGHRYEAQGISTAVFEGILTGQDYSLVAYDPGNPIYNVPV
jgi:hypothetical protein